MDFRCCAILLPDGGGRQMRIEGAHRLPRRYIQEINDRHKIRLQVGPLSEGPTTRAFVRGEVQVVPDVRADAGFAPWRSLAERHGFRSLVCVPLRLRGRPIGVLNGYGGEPRAFPPEEVALLGAAAAQAAIAIELARRLDEQRRTIARLEDLAAALEEQQRVQARAQEIHRRLTEVVLSGRGVAAIADALAGLVGAPVLIWDRWRRPAACSLPPSAGGEPHVAGQPKDSGQPEAGRAPGAGAKPVAGGVPRAGGGRPGPGSLPPLSGVPRSNRPVRVRMPRTAGAGAALVAPVVVDGRALAYVGALEGDGRFGDLEVRALEHGATVLALEMARQRVVRETEERLRADLLHDLLEGRCRDARQLSDRARAYGIDTSRPHLVAVVDLDDFQGFARSRRLTVEEADQARLQALRRAESELKGRIPGVATALVGGRLTAVCPVGEDGTCPLPAAFEAAQAGVARSAAGLTLSAGVGRECRDVGDYPEAYRAARFCLDVVRRLDLRSRLLRLDEVGLFRLLFETQDPARLVEFARGVLAPLLPEARGRGADLLASLAGYIDAGGDLGRAALRLCVHVNTLKYRLRRIGQLTGLDPRRPADLLQLTLAATVHRLLAGGEGAGGPDFAGTPE
jgi:sugar diacid utilization regulator